MTHATISILFYISLILILPIGGYLMYRWGKKIVRPIARGIDKDRHINLNGIAFKTFVYMIPAIVGFFVFAIPVIFFSSLLKKEDYCMEVIKFNKLEKNDPFLKERCSCLDHDELFKRAANKRDE